MLEDGPLWETFSNLLVTKNNDAEFVLLEVLLKCFRTKSHNSASRSLFYREEKGFIIEPHQEILLHDKC